MTDFKICAELPKGPIGVFDSGYGGLTILRQFIELMPEYDYMFLGDNARAPYGTRGYETVYEYTLQGVKFLFEQGCPLVILGCNTASARALRTIQQRDLPQLDPNRRVLGVIRPTVEALGAITRNGHIGILGTPGTIGSKSYDMEIAKLYPDFKVTGHGCPMWVPLVENCEAYSPGADYFVDRDIQGLMEADPEIDTLVLGCTHYPLLLDTIRRYIPQGVEIVSQGEITAHSLRDYLCRHQQIDSRCLRRGIRTYFTTGDADSFGRMATVFMGRGVEAHKCVIDRQSTPPPKD